MVRGVPEAWARRGTAQDIIQLLRLHGQLAPAARQQLTLHGKAQGARVSLNAPPILDHPPQRQCTNLLDSVGSKSRTSDEDSFDQTIALVRIFAAGDQGKLLTEAVEALARQKMDPFAALPFDAVDPYEWLHDLAVKSYPILSDVARLIGLAEDFQPDARSMIFTDGWLEPMLCSSQNDYVLGESIYAGYMYVLETADDYLGLMPKPRKYFNIHVAQDDYIGFSHDEGWTLDKAAWEAEVQHRCVLQFASFVSEWRGNFFNAVLGASTDATDGSA